MKENKGFTLVEVIVSFALTMIIVLFLFQLIITLKNVYNHKLIISNLILKQSNINQMINSDLIVSNLGDIISVSNDMVSNCYNISFQYGSRNICYNKENNTISYNDYEFELIKNSKIGDVSVVVNNGMLFIDIPITYPDIDNNFDVKIAYFNRI